MDCEAGRFDRVQPRRPVLLLALLILASAEAPAKEWTEADTQRQLVYSVLHILDWGQTLDIENHPGHYESNVVLGKHPSRGEINTYFAVTLGLHWLAARALPPKWRRGFQLGTMALELGVLGNNYQAGIRIRF